MKLKIPRKSAAGFSLVEVTLAIGVIAFAFVALLGMLPVGLNTHRQSVDLSRSLVALNRVASALRSAHFTGVISNDANYAFPQFFSDNPNPSISPTTFYVRQANYSLRFFLLEDGSIRLGSATNTTSGKDNFPKAVIYCLVDSPGSPSSTAGNNTFAGPAKMYAVVTWPYIPSQDDAALATTTRAGIAARIGARSFLETMIVRTPEPR
jgi:type II secretory pathway pseudopilin PulG